MKKRSFIVILICMFVLPVSLRAKKIAEMPEVVRPKMMAIEGTKLFIADGASILIYSLKDFKLVKKFGKSGEGPQEFMVNPRGGPGMMIYTTPQYLLVNTDNKLSFFTREGEFIREMKAPVYTVFMPLAEGYAANGFAANDNNQRVLTVNLHDSNLNKIKELYISDTVIGSGSWQNLPGSQFNFQTYKNRIFVLAAKDGFAVDVFDSKGNKLYQVKKDEPKLKVTGAFKKRAIDWFEHESPFKRFFDRSMISFGKEFPALQDIAVTDDRIYAFTYKKQDDSTECVVMNLKGKEIQRVFLPMPYKTPLGFSHPSTFANHRYYTLIDSEEEETWELHLEELKR